MAKASTLNRPWDEILAFIEVALGERRCRIIQCSIRPKRRACISFLNPFGDRIEIACYAFVVGQSPGPDADPGRRAFRIDLRGRADIPPDQVRGLLIELVLGVDLENGLFVGVDPMMHDPAEPLEIGFTEAEISKIRKTSWYAWEREHPEEWIDPIEILVGGVQARFFEYVLFEWAAAGLDQGPRHLLADTYPLVPLPRATRRTAPRTPRTPVAGLRRPR